MFDGELNQGEISFLLQYAVNDLMSAGVMFNLDEDDQDENAMRIRFPDGSLN